MKIEEVLDKFTDFIAEEQYLIFWGFEFEALEKEYGEYYHSVINKAFLLSLKELGNSKNTRLRERCFTVWMGDYLWGFWIGIPGNISSEVVMLMSQHLKRIFGFKSLEFGNLPNMGLIPRYRYEKGEIIEYSEIELAGETRIDNEEWYGTGLEIHYRYLQPASLIGEEKYSSSK